MRFKRWFSSPSSPQPLDIRHLHAAVLRLPVVVGGIRHAVFAADVIDLAAALHFLQHTDDLGLRESWSAYFSFSLPVWLWPRTPIMHGAILWDTNANFLVQRQIWLYQSSYAISILLVIPQEKVTVFFSFIKVCTLPKITYWMIDIMINDPCEINTS